MNGVGVVHAEELQEVPLEEEGGEHDNETVERMNVEETEPQSKVQESMEVADENSDSEKTEPRENEIVFVQQRVFKWPARF